MVNSVNELLGPRNEDFQSVLDPRNPRSNKTQKQTEGIANYLVEKFSASGYRNVFLKIAWHLDEGTISKLVETAFERASNPRAYFITIAKQHKDWHD